jgi:hypothetical protein
VNGCLGQLVEREIGAVSRQSFGEVHRRDRLPADKLMPQAAAS